MIPRFDSGCLLKAEYKYRYLHYILPLKMSVLGVGLQPVVKNSTIARGIPVITTLFILKPPCLLQRMERLVVIVTWRG